MPDKSLPNLELKPCPNPCCRSIFLKMVNNPPSIGCKKCGVTLGNKNVDYPIEKLAKTWNRAKRA